MYLYYCFGSLPVGHLCSSARLSPSASWNPCPTSLVAERTGCLKTIFCPLWSHAGRLARMRLDVLVGYCSQLWPCSMFKLVWWKVWWAYICARAAATHKTDPPCLVPTVFCPGSRPGSWSICKTPARQRLDQGCRGCCWSSFLSIVVGRSFSTGSGTVASPVALPRRWQN